MDINKPLVSILMTSYNREKYIEEAIKSVLRSTYKNFELIIVDDGSKDSTVEIAQKYAATDYRIAVYINEKNLGDYPNRNKAASYAKGKYLKYVDSDDLVYPWGLELLVSMMEEFPDAGWGLCTLSPDNDRIFPFQLSPKEAYSYHYGGLGLFNKSPLSAIIKRDVFYEAGEFSPIRMAGDFDMWHRLAQKFPVVLMPQGIIWYRKHGDQEMNDYKKFVHVYHDIRIKYLSSHDCPLQKDQREAFLKQEKSSSIKTLLKKTVKKLIKQ